MQLDEKSDGSVDDKNTSPSKQLDAVAEEPDDLPLVNSNDEAFEVEAVDQVPPLHRAL
jgi:hypothetical protein